MTQAVEISEPTYLTVTIDTEEDNWGSYAGAGATVHNIEHLREVQDLLARWGARPTYLVNRPPLLDAASVEILGALAATPGVEIGGHCHPWNTPPSTGHGNRQSMMCNLPAEANRAKIAEVTKRIRAELGVGAQSFRAGRWGFGPTVSRALAAEGYLVDSSVTPLVDWREDGGPDYSKAPRHPYRFDPSRPFEPDAAGSMVEIPTTVGFLGGKHQIRGAIQEALRRKPLRYLRMIGTLDRLGTLSRRWLSPETSTGPEMVRLAETCLKSGEPVLDLTFHSCTLLPSATPFVADEHDRTRFLDALGEILSFMSASGVEFRTLREVGKRMRSVEALA